MLLKRYQSFRKTLKSWAIPDINQLLERADCNGHEDPVTVSENFSEDIMGHLIEWKVELKISRSKLFPGGLSLSFIPISGMDDDICNFYLVDIDKNHLYIGLSDQSTYTNREDPDFIPSRFNRPKEKLLPNNTMTLHIEVFSYFDCDRYPWMKCLSNKTLIVEIPNDYFELYKRQKDSGDVVDIQVQDNTFPVHRNLLEKRCPVLYEKVVRHQQTSDSNNNSKLTLRDIDAKIFERVVEYIYTDKVCNLNDHSEYLLEAADKYELIRLKKMCEQSIVFEYLEEENAPVIYDLAIRCHAPQLKEAALVFRPAIETPDAARPSPVITKTFSKTGYDVRMVECTYSTPH
ncbi:speckle-type POZ protein-like [Microplitis mediator]|uniref:speckle-type POZ protein-like n=1 Tax=Microplitis mediator TaxID=375433 RepID=UPI0025529E32|nr:speckle-type POZ protein-like [Microplitis mediator]XP_057339957.1 speckle-type POZ protein-like [Microplitis mediator]